MSESSLAKCKIFEKKEKTASSYFNELREPDLVFNSMFVFFL